MFEAETAVNDSDPGFAGTILGVNVYTLLDPSEVECKLAMLLPTEYEFVVAPPVLVTVKLDEVIVEYVLLVLLDEIPIEYGLAVLAQYIDP